MLASHTPKNADILVHISFDTTAAQPPHLTQGYFAGREADDEVAWFEVPVHELLCVAVLHALCVCLCVCVCVRVCVCVCVCV